MNIFFFFFFLGGGGIMKLWIFLEEHHITELFWGSFKYISGLFRSMYRIGLFLRVAKFQIFLGIPDVPNIFWGG